MSEVVSESSLGPPEEPWGSNILLVEDNAADAKLVSHMLARIPGEFHVHHVQRLEAALEALHSQEFSVVLLDLSLPDGAGPATVKDVSAAAPGAPIVVLTGYSEEEIAIEAIQAGAQDFLTKGRIDGDGLLRSMRFAIERKRSETRLAYLALHDPLTGLSNRTSLRDRLSSSLARAERSGEQLAVLFLDLDRFKAINDSLGHDVGDDLLVQVGRRLRASVRSFETVARLGGDEFVVVLEGLAGREGAEVVARRIIEAMEPDIELGEVTCRVSTSVGIALAEGGEDLDVLLERADQAMYQAKRAGRGTFQVWQPPVLDNEGLGPRDIVRALEAGELELLYQPILELGGFSVVGAEAFLRWQHPERGEISPGELLPLLSSEGLMAPVGEWVLRRACMQALPWTKTERFRLAVNLAAEQLETKGFAETVADVLRVSGFPAQDLELDVTCEAIARAGAIAFDTMTQLREIGVRIAIDDVKVETPLAEVARCPVDVIKIDRTLVARATEDTTHAAVVCGVIGMARRLGAETVAEGVETTRELTTLRKLGCDSMQGYQLSRPMSAASLTVWLAAHEADG